MAPAALPLERLPFVPSDAALPAEVAPLFDRAAAAAARFTDRASPERVPELVATKAAPAWAILSAARDRLPLAGETFCEWGAGIGAVSCLAARLGWRARGIEQAPGLLAAARDFARAEGLDVRLEAGDYAPPSHGHVPGADPFGADLTFVFAWPAETRWLPARFAEGAARGAILLVYEGGVRVTALRRL